jgi:hypothetical protein
MHGRFFGGRRVDAAIYDGVSKYGLAHDAGGASGLQGEETEEQEKARLERYARWLEQGGEGSLPQEGGVDLEASAAYAETDDEDAQAETDDEDQINVQPASAAGTAQPVEEDLETDETSIPGIEGAFYTASGVRVVQTRRAGSEDEAYFEDAQDDDELQEDDHEPVA